MLQNESTAYRSILDSFNNAFQPTPPTPGRDIDLAAPESLQPIRSPNEIIPRIPVR